ncbi:hypothetical protein C0991_009847 [Blastosporella zonata]|nr:hypothetical protein C0991_009847 [Blastosporella zonata]
MLSSSNGLCDIKPKHKNCDSGPRRLPQRDAEELRKELPGRKRGLRSVKTTSTQTCSQTRVRGPADELGSSVPPKFLFTPADTPPAYSVTESISTSPKIPNLRSNSSPHITAAPIQSPYARRLSAQIYSESEDDRGEEEEDGGLMRTAWSGSTGNLQGSGSGLRTRIFGIGHRERPKTICTTPGLGGAGETETEIDEPPRHLPTARIIPASDPLVPPSPVQQQLTPFLFEFSRLLSIVPAVFGTLYNLYRIYRPPTSPRAPERVDFAVSALWAILTGYQCLCLTTGLLTRWRLYYPPLPTLIRLLALQGICWPATQLTCTILEHGKRPVIVWAVIGTTTCVSRSVQIWVTSNLWWETREVRARDRNQRASQGTEVEKKSRSGYWKRWGGGTWGGRRWDWKEVGVKFLLARRELKASRGLVFFIGPHARSNPPRLNDLSNKQLIKELVVGEGLIPGSMYSEEEVVVDTHERGSQDFRVMAA